jgi:hypothetical protein
VATMPPSLSSTQSSICSARSVEGTSQMEAPYRVSERRACEALAAVRLMVRYVSIRPSQDALRHRLRELATVALNAVNLGVMTLRSSHDFRRR